MGWGGVGWGTTSAVLDGTVGVSGIRTSAIITPRRRIVVWISADVTFYTLTWFAGVKRVTFLNPYSIPCAASHFGMEQ